MDDFEKQMKLAFHVLMAVMVIGCITLLILIILSSDRRYNSKSIKVKEPVNNTYRLESVSGRL
jgi:hypothetical protein